MYNFIINKNYIKKFKKINKGRYNLNYIGESKKVAKILLPSLNQVYQKPNQMNHVTVVIKC